MSIVFVGMETSGAYRRRFQALGFETYSCDMLPSEDGGEEMAFHSGLPMGRHLIGDVFETLDHLWSNDLWPDLAIFHPTCTYLTGAAEWSYGDGPYHQKVKPETLTGRARREARQNALNDVRRIMALPIHRKVIENPVGVISTRIMPVSETVQPYEFGDDASKRTCHWYLNKDGDKLSDMLLPRDPDKFVQPTLRKNGKRYWSNQTDTGQNRLSPGADRWKERSRTYAGVADAAVAHWSKFLF